MCSTFNNGNPNRWWSPVETAVEFSHNPYFTAHATRAKFGFLHHSENMLSYFNKLAQIYR